MIQSVDSKQFTSFYARMGEEFPPSEMKPMETFVDLLNAGKYRCFGYYENDRMVGYAMGLLASNDILWLDYLHIFKENQSKGYGSRLLKSLLDEIAINGILLETEAPDCSDYNEIKNRRLRFYDRFDIHLIDCPYLFPCADGTTIDSLDLQYIPSSGKSLVRKEELQLAIKEAVGTIHSALPHAQAAMSSYIDKIRDLPIHRFSLEDVDINDEEQVKAIGRLVYLTDPYVYPDLFDNDIELSIKCAKAFLKKDTFFNYKNIKIGKIDCKTAGFFVILKDKQTNNREEMKAAMMESINRLTPKFDAVMEGYFDTLDYQWEGLQIMSLAVLPEYRRHKVATKMLNSLPGNKTYSLACVKDNEAGRRLYEKCGFVYKFDYPGYTDIMCVELARRAQ